MDKQIRNFILFAIFLDLIVGAIIGQFLPLQEATIETGLLAVFVSGVIAFVILQISSYITFKEWIDEYELWPVLIISWGIMMFFAGLF